MSIGATVLNEFALDAAIDQGAERAFTFLERLVAAPSTVGTEASALTIFAEELAGIGFRTQRIAVPDDIGTDPRAGVPQEVSGERYDVVGRIGPDNNGPSLLLNGHMDVVPAMSPHRWTGQPFVPRRDGNRLFGRGSGDMKCGFAMGVLAIRALLDVAPDILSGPLSFVAVIEEECTGNGTLAAANAGVLADAVILLEPTELDIMVGGVGVMWCDVEIVGYSTHAQTAHLSINPIDLVGRLIAGLREWSAGLSEAFPDEELADVESPYNVNVGGIQGGDWPSSVPTEATVRLRIGFPRAWTPDDAEREIRSAVSAIVKKDGGFPVEPTLRLSGFRAPGYLLDHDHPLVRAMAAAHVQAHGVEPKTFSLGSTTDARTYINYFGTPALCFGPSASNIHGLDESVDLDSIVAGAKTLARFIATWFERDRI
jgi:acetylornithine deacetylase